MKKLVFIILIALLSNVSNAQDLSHSVYVGTATGTNVGGAVGIGTEIILNKHLSGCFAIGSVHPILKEKVDKSKFDFDIGLKLYPIKYFYLGLNYGFIDGVYSEFGYADGSSNFYYKETRGFSFTIGGRTPEYNKFYLSAFLGITSNNNANCYDGIGGKIYTPRIGIIIGYCF